MDAFLPAPRVSIRCPTLRWVRGGLSTLARSQRLSSALLLGASATNLVLLVVGLGTSVLVSRALGVEARGEYFRWQLWSTVVGPLPAVALAQAVVTFAPDTRGLTLRSIAPLATAAGAACAVAAGLALVSAGSPPLAILGGAFLAAATVVQGLLIALHQRAGEVGMKFNLVRFAPQGAALATMIGLALGGREPAVWFFTTSVVQAVTVMVSAALAIGSANSPRINQLGLAREALRLTPVNLASLVQYRADSLAATLILPASGIGLYAVGSAAQSVTFAAGQSGGMVWFGVGRHRSPASAAIYAYAVGGVIAVIICLLAEPAVGLLYGSEFLPAVGVVRILAIAGVLQAIDYIALHVLMVHAGSRIAVAWKVAHILAVAIAVVVIFKEPSIIEVATVALAAYAVVSSVLFAVALRMSSKAREASDSMPPLSDPAAGF